MKQGRQVRGVVGVVCLLVSLSVILHAPDLVIVSNLVTPLGVVLLIDALRHGFDRGTLRLVLGGAAAVLLSFLVRWVSQTGSPTYQLLLVLASAMAIGAVGSAVPPRARRLGYGILIAAAWAVMLTTLFGSGAIPEGTTFFRALVALVVLAGTTLVFRTWTFTGLPPRSLTRFLKLKDRTVKNLWGEPTDEPRLAVTPSPPSRIETPGDAESEIRTIST